MDVDKATYEARLKDIKVKTDPIVQRRYPNLPPKHARGPCCIAVSHRCIVGARRLQVTREREATDRPDAFSALQTAIDKYAAFVASEDELYAHIAKEEKDKVAAEVAAAKEDLAAKQALVAAMGSKAADPPFKARRHR